jgi:hypothetical protein
LGSRFISAKDFAMAYAETGLTKLENLKPLAATPERNTSGLFYYETADNLATVTGAGYFNNAREFLGTDARILAICSDGGRFLKMTVPDTGNVTSAAVLLAAS